MRKSGQSERDKEIANREISRTKVNKSTTQKVRKQTTSDWYMTDRQECKSDRTKNANKQTHGLKAKQTRKK